MGADMAAPESWQTKHYGAQWDKCIDYAKFVADFIVTAGESGVVDMETVERKQAVTDRRRRQPEPPSTPHIPECTADGVRCKVCGKEARTLAQKRIFSSQTCRQSFTVVGSDSLNWVGAGHSVYKTGCYFWCMKCGSHCSKKSQNLALACPLVPRSQRAKDCKSRLSKGLILVGPSRFIGEPHFCGLS